MEAKVGSVFKCRLISLLNDIPLHEPPFQASSSPIPRIREWLCKIGLIKEQLPINLLALEHALC